MHSTNTVGLITNTAVAIKVIHPEPQPVKPPVSSGITLFSPVRSGITFFAKNNVLAFAGISASFTARYDVDGLR